MDIYLRGSIWVCSQSALYQLNKHSAMKNRLIISVLCILGVVVGRGQNDTARFNANSYPFKFDTIPCMILVTDSSIQKPNRYGNNWPGAIWDDNHMLNCFTIYGYEIDKVFYYKGFAPEFVSYLGNDKKPLPYFVWMSKEINQIH